MSRPHFNRSVGSLYFHSRHEILDQMAMEMLCGLPSEFRLKKRTHIYCGIHQSFPFSFLNFGYKIGIQTEQFFDESGNELFGLENKKGIENIKSAIDKYDCILDLSFSNSLFYDRLAENGLDVSKIKYGPHIFFENPPQYISCNESSGKFLFFGSLEAPRRKKALQALGEKCVVLEAGVHYNALYDEIKKSSGVLNLHYQDAIYTEVPRMLTALTCGKTLVSEQLASPFVAGTHYHHMGGFQKDQDYSVYTTAVDYLSKNYSFLKFLRQEGLVV